MGLRNQETSKIDQLINSLRAAKHFRGSSFDDLYTSFNAYLTENFPALNKNNEAILNDDGEPIAAPWVSIDKGELLDKLENNLSNCSINLVDIIRADLFLAMYGADDHAKQEIMNFRDALLHKYLCNNNQRYNNIVRAQTNNNDVNDDERNQLNNEKKEIQNELENSPLYKAKQKLLVTVDILSEVISDLEVSDIKQAKQNNAQLIRNLSSLRQHALSSLEIENQAKSLDDTQTILIKRLRDLGGSINIRTIIKTKQHLENADINGNDIEEALIYQYLNRTNPEFNNLVSETVFEDEFDGSYVNSKNMINEFSQSEIYKLTCELMNTIDAMDTVIQALNFNKKEANDYFNDSNNLGLSDKTPDKIEELRNKNIDEINSLIEKMKSIRDQAKDRLNSTNDPSTSEVRSILDETHKSIQKTAKTIIAKKDSPNLLSIVLLFLLQVISFNTYKPEKPKKLELVDQVRPLVEDSYKNALRNSIG